MIIFIKTSKIKKKIIKKNIDNFKITSVTFVK